MPPAPLSAVNSDSKAGLAAADSISSAPPFAFQYGYAGTPEAAADAIKMYSAAPFPYQISQAGSQAPATAATLPAMMMPFPVHPAAMYGQMHQMQMDIQAVQQQVGAGLGPLTAAQQAELARARQRGQRAAIAKQKLNKQKAALAARKAKAEAEAAKKKQASKRKRADDDEEGDDDEGEASAKVREAIEATDVSALAAMTPEQQNEEIDKKLSGVECVKEQKRLKRLLRNRVSAQQARERKKSYLSSLEDKSKEQENEIAMLNEKVQSLQQENTMLRQVVKNIRMKDSNQ